MAFTLPDRMIKRLFDKEVQALITADYEEGTFTATLTGTTANPTTPVTATANYVRIGNLVTVNISIINADCTGASGTIGITGLPFTAKGYRCTGSAISNAFGTTVANSYIDPNSAKLVFVGSLLGTGVAFSGTLTARTFYTSLTYKVT